MAVIVALFTAAGGVVALAWALQRSLVFLPDTTPAGSAAHAVEGGRDLTLVTRDGVELDAWLIPPATTVDRETAVLYAPGNGGNREGRLGIAGQLAEEGFTILLVDYRGYGGNEGSPSEEGLAHDAVAAAEALAREGFAPERILYLGESIGTGVVARLQSTHPPAGVLLRSPFTEFTSVAREHYGWLGAALLRDEFPVVGHLAGSEVPVTVVHGTDDDIVPSALSAEVAASVGNLHEELVLDGVGHNDAVMFGRPVAEAMSRLADHAVPR
ncbi:alpha/beta hydrolase [Aeromicrobium sp. PE09-221]|nr:alpha/beta hydrolase [Aeromicrobium sp. PE09-221]